MRATRALAIGTAWAFAAACATEDPTLAVQLRTDLAPGVEFIAVRTEVFPSLPVAAGESPSARAEIAAYRDSDLATGARVAELDVSAGAQTVRVTLLDSDRREVISTLSRVDVSGTTIVTVVITRDCREVMCPAAGDSAAAIACLGGRCVDPRCSVERPELCGTSECAADVDCVPTNACAAGRCELGSCLFVDADRCGPDQWCDPALGCRAIEGPSPDGGERDAGRRDAGPGPPDTGPGDSGPATPCGDGVRSGAEECDDGNRVSSDGCTAECAVERSPTCADGIVDHATFE